LDKKQIPYNTRKQINILDLPLILNIRLFLEYLNAEYQAPYSGEYLLYKILSLDFLGIPANDLAKMSFHLAPHHGDTNWRTLIREEVKLREIGVETAGPVIQFSQLLDELISQYRSYPLLTLIEKIINRSGLLASLLKKEDKEWHLQVISTFFGFVQKETDRNPRLTLDELLEIFNKLDANRLSVRIQKTIYHKNGVNLVTAHSSKGLEFQRVFMIDAVQDQWEPSRQSASRRFKLPDTVTLSGEADATEARRRLFYVAMTRAKEFLHISYAKKNNVGKTLQRTLFVDEILSDGSVEIIHKTPAPKAMFDAQLLLLLSTEKPKIEEQNREAIAGLLEGKASCLPPRKRSSFLRQKCNDKEDILRPPALIVVWKWASIICNYTMTRPSNSRFTKFTERNPHGGLYRRQLIFYKLLYEATQNEFFARQGSIAYFEPDHEEVFTIKSVEFTSQEVQMVKDLIKTSYDKIMEQDFYEGCGEDNCKWCNFVKNNVAVDSFTDLEDKKMKDQLMINGGQSDSKSFILFFLVSCVINFY